MIEGDNGRYRTEGSTGRQPVVVLPVIDREAAQRLVPLALALAEPRGGRVVALGIVTVPEERPLSDGVRDTRRVRSELDAIVGQGHPVPVQSVLTVAHSHAEAIRIAAVEQGATVILLGWEVDEGSPERLFGPPIEDLLLDAPCDVVVACLRDEPRWPRILLPVRGGPHTELAYQVALAAAGAADGAVTVFYAADARRADDQAVLGSLKALPTDRRVSHLIVRDRAPAEAILEEAARHHALVLGVTARVDDPEAPIGPVATRILRHTNQSVILVRHHLAPSEEQAQEAWLRERNLAAAVDRWFAQNTFTSSEFEDLQRLVALKEAHGHTISLALPALNEEETLGEIIRITQETLVQGVPLLDEIVLIDSGSQDRTREIAESYGIPVYIHQEILPEYGSFAGKGEALWKSLHVLKGDLIAWVDTDIRNFDARLVYGILAPLLRQPEVVYSKGFYRRPIQHGDVLADSGGGRVTELTARPLLNLFYPELSGMMQPLSGEYAGRRTALERVPFFTGYGVETAMLIDLLEAHGLSALAQVDLHRRIHRNQDLTSLSRMAFAITQVVIQRLEQRQRVHLMEPVNQSMKLIRYAADEGFHLEVREIRDHERPPIITLPEYRARRAPELEASPV